MFRNKLFRWLLLTLGLFAIIALTGMNVYSLYDIRDKMVEGEEKRQLALLDDMVHKIRRQFYAPLDGLGSLELEPVERTIANEGKFPPLVQEKIINVSKQPLFDGIYYTPEGTDPCQDSASIYVFDYSDNEMDYTDVYPSYLPRSQR